MAEVRARKISDYGSFFQAWKAKASASDVKPFNEISWVSSLMETVGDDATIFTIDVEAGQDVSLVGFVGVQKQRSFLHEDVLMFMESGDEALDRVYPEYLDFIGDAERTLVISGVFDIFDQIGEFQFRNCGIVLQQSILEAAANLGLRTEIFRTQPTYHVDLQKVRDESEFIALVSKSLRGKIRRSKKIYRERGDLVLSVAATPSAREQAFRDLKRLHAATWEARGEKGVFANAQVVKFHETLISKWPDHVELLSLTAGTDVVGVLYNLKRGKYVCNYQSGFLMEKDNRLAPGFVMHAMAADHYAKAGYETYDFLAGDAEYKRRLGEPGEELYSIAVTRPSWRSLLRTVVSGAKAFRAGRS